MTSLASRLVRPDVSGCIKRDECGADVSMTGKGLPAAVRWPGACGGRFGAATRLRIAIALVVLLLLPLALLAPGCGAGAEEA